jgi:DNA replicative helicase MCM subunit Mcm2 (Cdc46/Mcm family)
MTVLLG